MATLQEMLAAKKAKAQGTLPSQEAVKMTESIVAALEIPAAIIVPKDIVNTEVAVTHIPKKLTFKELMDQKKQTGGTLSVAAPVGNVVKDTAVLDTTTAEEAATEIQETKAIEHIEDAEQAYADIKPRIDALLSLSDTPLENAMKDLKKALLANPNAVALMEDTDFGKMVIGLRNMTKEAAVESLKEKISGKKSKSKMNLDPDAVALAFEEI